MKTRNDFVSNSSSCSFVIALSESLPLNDFVDEVCDACLKHADDESEAYLAKQDGFNRAVLNYHLRASELLYLGCLDVGSIRTTYVKDDCKFEFMKKQIATGDFYQLSDSTLVENTDDKIVVDYEENICEIAIPTHNVESVTGVYLWDENDYSQDINRQSKAAAKIVEFAKKYSDYVSDYKMRNNSNTYFISRRTIWNTRALIAAGYKVELDEWMDLDKLEKLIVDNKCMLFSIRVNNGGDGVDDDALYSFGGWEGEDVLDNISGIEMLDSDTM